MIDKDGESIFIDDDWKKEAQREKERLAQKERGAPPPGDAPPSFAELVNVIVVQAVAALGGMVGPGGQRIPPDPAAARHFIDLLGVLEQKTAGNLNDEEKALLDTVLYELRMTFVHGMGGRPAPPPASNQAPQAGGPKIETP